ncbi:type 4a pilus biogenesis protein PilO [Thermodesulfobacteriota bacterium]
MKKISLDKIGPLLDTLANKVAKLSRIQRFLIVIVMLAIIIGPFVYFVYLPKTDTINKLTKEHEELEAKLAKLKIKAAKLKRLQAEKRKMEADFKIVRKALPNQKEIPDLLATISRAGSDSGLAFKLFKPLKPKKKGFYSEIPVKLSVTGGYHNVAQFFDKVAQLPRIVNMQNISIKTAKGTNLSTSCTAVTYMFVPEKKKKKKKKKK